MAFHRLFSYDLPEAVCPVATIASVAAGDLPTPSIAWRGLLPMRLPKCHQPARKLERVLLGINGLTYLPGVFSERSQLAILAAVDEQPWLTDLRRRVQHYGYRYEYRKRSVDFTQFLGPLPDFAIVVASELLARGLLDEPPDQMIVNEYLPGQGIAAHIDCEPCFKDRIATVSLGSACQMDFISNAKREVRSHLLSPGSVLTLSGEARYDWMHRIPARKNDGGLPRVRRVSLTFRNVILHVSD